MTTPPFISLATKIGFRPRSRITLLVVGLWFAAGCQSLDFDRPLLDQQTGSTDTTPEKRIRLELLDTFLPGQLLTANIHIGHRRLGNKRLYAHAESQLTGDAVELPLEFADDPTTLRVSLKPTERVMIVRTDGEFDRRDNQLELAPSERFVFTFYPKGMPGFDDIEGGVADIATFSLGDESDLPVVNPAIALEDREVDAALPCGTLLRPGTLPVAIALNQLMAWFDTRPELDAFVQRVSGELLASWSLGSSSPRPPNLVALIRLPPPSSDPVEQRRVALSLRNLMRMSGDDRPIIASRPEVIATLQRTLELRHEGYAVAVNPRLESHAPPAFEPETIAEALQNRPLGCSTRHPTSCVANAEAAWAFMELWDQQRSVKVAVIEPGFAPNEDFRVEGPVPFLCDVSTSGNELTCSDMQPAVLSKLRVDESDHGTATVEVLGAVHGNGLFTAGVAGQIAVPLLYQYGRAAYSFELAQAVRHAAARASLIHLSAGYPCHGLSDLGPDRDRCTAGGEDHLCTALRQQLAEAAQKTCERARSDPRSTSRALTAAALAELCEIGAGRRAVSHPACSDSAREYFSPLVDAIREATDRGVPVVTSAGNVPTPERLPEGIRPFVDARAFQRVDQAGTLPALLPEVITAGAVDAATFANSELYGERVDVWAPTPFRWFGPASSTSSAVVEKPPFAGTSAAAAYVSGAIALLQSWMPELDAQSDLYKTAPPEIADAQRRTIVPRVRDLLRADEHGFDAAELAEGKLPTEGDAPRQVISPLDLVRTASRGALATAGADAYDTSLNFSERTTPDDTPEQATTLAVGRETSGTILTLPATSKVDIDYYTFTMPASDRPQQVAIELSYPPGRGALTLVGVADPVADLANGRVSASILAAGQTRVTFAVTSSLGDDNVYKIWVAQPTAATPSVRIQGARPISVCSDRLAVVQADARLGGADGVMAPESAFTWYLGSNVVMRGRRTLSLPLAPGSYTLRAVVYEASDEVVITSSSCTPTATILRPSADLAVVDAGQGLREGLNDAGVYVQYAIVNLQGRGRDYRDAAIADAGLLWTFRSAYASPDAGIVLGTGESLPNVTLQKYVCDRPEHVLELRAFDGEGRSSVPQRRNVTLGSPDCLE